MNHLYYGDNLDILRRYIKDESVDLIYLDPPFNSKRDYNAVFSDKDGRKSTAQVKAFVDTWHWDNSAARAYDAVVDNGTHPGVAECLSSFRSMLGTGEELAYLSMMAIRLVELRRVLKSTGSIFLHVDPTMSHYLKVLMDSLFGIEHYRNEIVWCYTGPGSPRQRQFSRKHDIIHWYSKSGSWTFNGDAVRIPHSKKTAENYKHGHQGSGFAAGDAVVKRELHQGGKIPEDYWPFAIAPRGKEYLGYPTQKPEALLERIILAASDESSVVLDPFCGCGTAVAVAQRLNRNWIGIDITHLAVNLIRSRLMSAFGDSVKSTFDVIGEPITVEDAVALAQTENDKYQFQFWALGLVGARPEASDQKKGADKGIDGKRFFSDETKGGTKTVIISVKGGKSIPSTAVRDLRGTIEREKAEIGVLISLAEPTKNMREDAAAAGFYTSPMGGKYPRLQLLTIKNLLDGHGIEMPSTAQTRSDVTTIKQAKRAQKGSDQASLDL